MSAPQSKTREGRYARRRLSSVIAAAALLPLLAQAAVVAQDDLPRRIEKARSTARDLSAQLLASLQKAMNAGGPVNAMSVCTTAAPKIAAEKSAAAQIRIRRTSLKLRQPKNAPDAWEQRQLQNFEARKAAGENPAAIEVGEFTEKSGRPVFRYMKAIPTTHICLNCHGTQLAPDVAKKLHALYPKDRATGFATGDLRGAFTIIAPR
jgi:hypothetical protein